MNLIVALLLILAWGVFSARAQTPPGIAQPPQGKVIAVGGTAVFSATVTGSTPLSYQWQKNGSNLAGQTSATLTLANVQIGDTGAYALVVGNAFGSATSAAANLEVVPAARLSNVAIRTGAGAGSETLIVGITIGGGSGSLPTLTRGIGPGLLQFGVSDALLDPRLAVFAGSTVITSNEDWGGGSTVAQLAQQVGAFVLPANSKDAALGVTFAPGGYTVQIAGADGATGVALAEVYDATPAGSLATTALRLTNCSARAQVGTGNGILIAGFTISGSGEKRILVRGLGPALTQFGVSGALEDPLLAIYANATLIANNDDWGGTEVTEAFGQAGAFPLASGSRDAAVVVTLPPGSYTAQVKGFGGATGVGLVELYELP